MTKIQLAYRFSGEKIEDVTRMLKKITKILEEKGHKVYAPALDKTMSFEEREDLSNSFRHIDDNEVLLAIIKDKNKSEGQLLEMGYAFAKKKCIFTVIHSEAEHDRVRKLSDKITVFSNTEDLLNKLKEVDL